MNLAESRLTVPEAARRLGMPGEAVYRLVFEGRLEAGPASDGAVYVSPVAVENYLRALSQATTDPRSD